MKINMHTFYRIISYNFALTLAIILLANMHASVLPGDYPPVKLGTTMSLAATSWYVFLMYYMVYNTLLFLVRCFHHCRRRSVSITMLSRKQTGAARTVTPPVPLATAENVATGQVTALYHDVGQQQQDEEQQGRDTYDEQHNDVGDDNDFVHGRPRLHMSDVWTLVYGLGFTYYVVNYVFTCRDLLSLQSFVWGLTSCVFIEIIQSEEPLLSAGNFIYLLSCLLASTGFLLRGSKDGYQHIYGIFSKQDTFGLVCGLFMPYMASLMFASVKANQKYAFRGIYDLCEFGFPFAIILAFATSGLERMYNNMRGGFETLPNFDQKIYYVAIFLSPILLLLIIILIMHAIMHSHGLDIIISLTLASSILTVAYHPKDQMALISSILTLLALFVRLTIVSDMVCHSTPLQHRGKRMAATSGRNHRDLDELDVDDQDRPRMTRKERVTHTIEDEDEDETARV